jgi:hypothetical protein
MIVFPIPLFLLTFLVLSLAAWLGATRFNNLRAQAMELSDEFGVIQGATLTLLGLIIGFTFSMALDRYEQRKGFESAEANAIATAYLRAEMLPDEPAVTRVKSLLRAYLDQRVIFYSSRNPMRIAEVAESTTRLQAELWSAVKGPAMAHPSPLTALAVASINDVLSSQGDTQAAWSNRIPGTAWVMMGAIAVCATMLVGIGLKRGGSYSRVLAVLPLVIAIAFFLIADIESPRLGIISVVPENLLGLAESLLAQ